MKVLRAKKYAKMKKNQVESAEKLQGMAERQSSSCEEDGGRSEMEKSNQVNLISWLQIWVKPYLSLNCL